MSEQQHTPGPWRVEERDGMARAHYGDHVAASHYSTPGATDGRDCVCDCKGPHGSANARLISAAPDLLAACEAVIGLGYCENKHSLCSQDYVSKSAIATIRAAISKATRKPAEAHEAD